MLSRPRCPRFCIKSKSKRRYFENGFIIGAQSAGVLKTMGYIHITSLIYIYGM